ncbi:ecto-ADP-ribosyltransferase 5-like [Xiphophorus maculatus]|uniref:NAD(P)(+)--arginine ADP-ribosyltransferase n=1 Tax=Xiphophorus maculatus TaxID=8083 RepID=M3ZWD9_XIPMA|nr:ecto-ADP-ribosyltransferase 5-like [Xiphophorus maculatus]XP_023189160.1 ecto-ADP-ribosyltransferase 5-like [Xiphophorus maculatus]
METKVKVVIISVVALILLVLVLGLGLGLGHASEKKKSQDCPPISLDMAPDSVDDMYDKCEEKMKEKIETDFLKNEKNKNKNFKEAWNKAEEYYNRKREKNNLPLMKEQIMAAHAYTLEEPPLYREFNNAVRTQKSEYKTKFPYHTLHFYLTMALRTIKPKPENCITGYRRASCKFRKDVLNKEIRFSAFSSSSADGYGDKMFGEESCFEITTCFGADISEFSAFKSEREVLIPPYEVFKVTEIKESSEHNKLPCNVVYKLQSTKTTSSNLNCAFFN